MSKGIGLWMDRNKSGSKLLFTLLHIPQGKSITLHSIFPY